MALFCFLKASGTLGRMNIATHAPRSSPRAENFASPLCSEPPQKSSQSLLFPQFPSELWVHVACDLAFLPQACHRVSKLQISGTHTVLPSLSHHASAFFWQSQEGAVVQFVATHGQSRHVDWFDSWVPHSCACEP